MSVFTTSHQGLATILRFILGDQSHIRTYTDGRNIVFEFSDPQDEAPELSKAFFDPEGMAIGNASSLLEMNRRLRQTIQLANGNRDGLWRSNA